MAVGVVLVLAAANLPAEPIAAWADRSSAAPLGSSTELICFTSAVNDLKQQLTVIDPHVRSISVYHIELATGVIELKSVRNINWDVQIEEFNNKPPTPKEVRSAIPTQSQQPSPN